MMTKNVSEYLREAARCFPDKIALVDQKREVSYRELLLGAEHIASGLIAAGLFRQPVAVLLDKGVDAILTFLGIAISGNFYTVIDTKMPEERVEKILTTFEPKAVVTDEKNREKLGRFHQRIGAALFLYKELSVSQMDSDRIRMTEQQIIDMDILYVLFTSGSTGIPKGVIISHRSVIDYTEWAAETFHFDSHTIFGNQAPFYFDNSVLDIYSTIRNGAALYIIPQMLFSFPIRLLEYIRDHNINTIFWVPTVLSRVADIGVLEHCDIGCLENILFAGEVMPAKQLNIWMRRLPDALYANLYGPTEITVDCTYFIVNRKIEDNEPVPIGYPCRNSDILVLNKENQLVKGEEKGELCVRGTSLSLGYYNNPEKTRRVFVQNPLHHLYEDRIYRTGDIVHYNERGELIYDGREDSQVKHTGHRIELGEIETAVSAVEGITMNCCLHRAAGDQLVLFYTGEREPKEIREQLAAALPEYMLPTIYHRLGQIPLNLNGKIDRIKLKESLEAVRE